MGRPADKDGIENIVMGIMRPGTAKCAAQTAQDIETATRDLVGIDGELRIRDVLLHEEAVDRGHDYVVTAVYDECWLLDRL